MEVETKKHAESQLKMEKFHNLKFRAYPHAKLNTSKMRCKKLRTVTNNEEIETALKNRE